KFFPQFTQNIKVADKAAVSADEAVQAAIAAVEQKINGNGRVLLRRSGTEPVVRVMVEAETEALCKEYTKEITDVIIERGHQVD
ncbi:MAG: phosphoglucosamine mutase, partial [Clostridia bacterium]|nr:phosphoglucosamine mutase [Clostridia bacterium]